MTGTTYTYDAKTGNLLKRSNVNTSAETFSYDKADRLTTGVTYAANGNIATKNNIGQYAYNSAKPHAVASVTNTGKLIPTDAQTVSYTTFNKVASVTQGSNSLNITYGPDHQRVKTVLKTSGSQQTRTYADNYEYRNINGTIQHLHYIYSPDGLTGVYIKPESGTATYYVAQTDNLGNVLRLYDKNGTTAYRATYDAWGRRTVASNTINFRRGFTGHEHWDEFALIDMNGRMYDPLIGRFLSPDPYVQAPTNSQNFNRYSYCLNNPLKYTDPSGELVWYVPMIAGAIAGTYMGGALANDNYNPTKWNYQSGSTWRYMAWGSVVGGASGYFGATIAASGAPFANTTSITFASLFNSIGTAVYTQGKTPVSVSFGAASYDFTNDSWGFLGKKGNKKIDNWIYGLGAMANVSDVLMGLHPEDVDLVTEHSDGCGHSAITKKGSKNGGGIRSIRGEVLDEESIISVGPDGSDSRSWHWMRGHNRWNTYSNGSADHPIWRETLRVNLKTINKYADFINQKVTVGTFIYSVELSSCVTHTSMALNMSGVFNIGIHPYLLHAQMYLRNMGVRPCLYSYLLNR